MLDSIHQLHRGVHIVAGTLGLLLFWIPLFARKGSRLHVLAGKWYIRTVYVVAISALISCTWAVASPLTYTGRAELSAHQITQIRYFLSILGVLAILTLKNGLLGERILQIKKSGEPLANLPLITTHRFQFAIGIGAIIFAGKLLIQFSFSAQYFILFVLGGLCALDFLGQREFINRPEARKHPILTHIECMIGCGIAFHTAALITIVNNVIKLELHGALALLPWLIPSMIGIPATAIICAQWVKKLNVENTNRNQE